MDDIGIRARVTEFALKTVSPIAFALVLVLIGLVLAGIISGQMGAAIGTLALAAMTALSVHSGLRQTRYMYEDLRFRRRPQVSIYHDRGEEAGSGWFAMENTGEVPVTLKFNLALVQSPCPSEDHAKIFDRTTAYEDLPEAVKLREQGLDEPGGQYLEPEEGTEFDEAFVKRLPRVREEWGQKGGAIGWLRIDAQLQSQYDEGDSRGRKRLFEVMVKDSVTYVSVSFEKARRDRRRLLGDMPEYDDPSTM